MEDAACLLRDGRGPHQPETTQGKQSTYFQHTPFIVGAQCVAHWVQFSYLTQYNNWTQDFGRPGRYAWLFNLGVDRIPGIVFIQYPIEYWISGIWQDNRPDLSYPAEYFARYPVADRFLQISRTSPVAGELENLSIRSLNLQGLITRAKQCVRHRNFLNLNLTQSKIND